MDDFKPVANRETVFDLDFRPAVLDLAHFADELAALRRGMAFEIILVFMRAVALQEAFRVAAIRQPVEFGQSLFIIE